MTFIFAVSLSVEAIRLGSGSQFFLLAYRPKKREIAVPTDSNS